MEAELKSLRIDRSKKRSEQPSRWATGWILGGIALILLSAGGFYAYGILTRAAEVDVVRVRAISAGDAARAGDVILNATGYIVAAHKIELAAKVVGKVSWIGVEKADRVKEGQALVRLEDDEYRAHLLEAQGQLNNLKAHLAELEHGSRPEEIAKARADLAQARATQENARV